MSTGKSDGTNEGALWGARFATGPSPELAALSRSTHFDWVLALYDIAGSHAHAKALAAAGYLTADEEQAMHAGLDELARGITDGTLLPGPGDEDVHGALEQALIGIVGPELGGKLRAGRSRNDQIATLVRMYLLDHSRTIARDILRLIDAIVAQADAHPDAIMPGPHAPAARAADPARASPAGARLAARARPRATAGLVGAGRGLAVRRGSARRLVARSRPAS